MAYRLLRGGKLNLRVPPGRDPEIPTHVVDEAGQAIIVKSSEVRSYFTEEFWGYYEMYTMTEIMGVPPYSGGWAEWPEGVARALAVFKYERQQVDEESRADGRHEAKAGNSAPGKRSPRRSKEVQ